MTADFAFERLDVYRRAIDFLAMAHAIARELPRGHAELSDQLRRASLSIPLNIAEGSGRTGVRDLGRHRAIARGSAMECAAILEVCRVLGLSEGERVAEARAVLVRVVQMLSKMCR